MRSSFLLVALAAASCVHPHAPTTSTQPGMSLDLVPAPARAEIDAGDEFLVQSGVAVIPNTSDATVLRLASTLARYMTRSTGIDVPVRSTAGGDRSSITLRLDAGASYGDEGYELTISRAGGVLEAKTAAGLFYGLQTIRLLLPYTAEYDALIFRAPRPAALPRVHIVDRPRYSWRGAMLDVSRHFLALNDVKRFVDLMALHKLNRLHLHLSDDQGWRIEVKSWPRLATVGGASQVGGGPGGFYTQEQYAELVAYAAERFVTIVPEIDMPGHTNAALSAYAELNCSGSAAPPYTGIRVGFSALCTSSESTYRFVDDVVREIAALTPGEFFHVGGDEVRTLGRDAYVAFVQRVQQIVASHGKTMIGWNEITSAELAGTTIVQHWRPGGELAAIARSAHLIVSLASRAYLDMKYTHETALGNNWAGLISTRDAYDWDPDAAVAGASPGAVIGIEAPLWSETLATLRDVEFLAFPRLAAIADLAWAPAATHDWTRFRSRLGAQAPRWTALGINFHRAPEIDWRSMP